MADATLGRKQSSSNKNQRFMNPALSKADIKKYSQLLLLLCTSCLIISCNKADDLKGIDKNVLFASPSQAELESVRTARQNRDLTAKGFRLEKAYTLSANGPLLQFVSFLVDNYREYGALIIPSSPAPLPVYMFFNGYSNDHPANEIHLTINTSANAEIPFIYAVPALRGQSLLLHINGLQYRSPASDGPHRDAFDGATDDAIAFLNVIQEHFPQANASRVAVRGGSRGGTVALLMAERDARVKRAVGVAFPADLIGLTASHTNDLTYKNQFLQGLINGTSTIAETRQKMIASSPVFFCESLPRTQVHFGTADSITPAAQGNLLHQRLQELGMADKLEMYTYPGKSHTDIAQDNPDLNNRIQVFFSELFQ